MSACDAVGKRVLVVTHELAQEVDGVIDELRARGLDVDRWNLCDYPNAAATATVDDLAFGEGAARSPADVGWLHNTGAFSIAAELDGLERDLAMRECDAFWQGALSLAARRWLNEPDAALYASNKLRQLRVAKDLGIAAPPFMASNDADAIRGFRSVHGETVVKAIRGGFVVHPDRSVKLVTCRIASSDEAFFEGLRLSPVLVQREIKKAHEARVTVVGDAAFAMFVNCQDMPDDVVDIRTLDYNNERWRFSAGPAEHPILKQSIAIVRALSLSYGGVDWAIDAEGEAFFLECNPLGAFKWAELCTGHNITGAIADALIARAEAAS